jgi:hypothetical protein
MRYRRQVSATSHSLKYRNPPKRFSQSATCSLTLEEAAILEEPLLRTHVPPSAVKAGRSQDDVRRL